MENKTLTLNTNKDNSNDENIKEENQRKDSIKIDNHIPYSISKSKLKRYPFNGESKYLLLKIMLIGYEKTNLEKLIKQKVNQREKEIGKHRSSATSNSDNTNNNQRKDINNKYDRFTLGEIPIILQSFGLFECNCLDNEMLLGFIYPKEPKIYQTDKENKPKTKNQHIVFSFNIPLTEGKKTSHNFYSYLDYEKVQIDNRWYLIPRGICFLSNFPYFDNYYLLAEYFYQNIYKKSFYEIWLYYIINLPSPINCSYKLNHFPSSEENHMKPILFTQLSGYPLFHFKLTELFNILPVEFIIEIFFFSFLENDMIFFSKHLEILNIVMYIFSNLNYPCNDSTYFFHTLSLSLEEFKKGLNPYTTKTFSCMFGINASYNPKYDQYVQKNDYFIVDLEKKEIHYRYKAYLGEKYDIKSNCILKEYIERIVPVKDNPKDSKELEIGNNKIGKLILELYFALNQLSQHITHSNIANNNREPFFFGFKDNNYEINKTIQEKFYYFNLAILRNFQSCYFFKLPNDPQDKYTIEFKDNKKISKTEDIESIFLNKFKECSKYNTYISNFILNNDSLDLFKIPLLFSEEFIWQLKSDKGSIKRNYSIFTTIDNFYQVQDKIGVALNLNHYYEWIKKPFSVKLLNKLNEELKDYIYEAKVNKTNPNSKKHREMTNQELYGYLYFFKSHTSEYKEIFQLDSKQNTYCLLLNNIYLPSSYLNTSTNVFYNGNDKTMKNNNNTMDKRTKLDYDVLLNDTNKYSDKDIEKKLASFKKKISNQNINEITSISPTYIQAKIEEKIIKEDKMSSKDIIFCSYILFFVLTRNIYTSNTLSQLKLILAILKEKKDLYSFRKCMSMLVIQYTEIIEQNITEGRDWDEEKRCLLELTAVLKELNFIPNEELLLYLNTAYTKGYFKVEELTQFTETLKAINNTDSSGKSDNTNKSNAKKNSTIENKKSKNTSYLQYNISKNGIRKESYIIELALNNAKYKGIILLDKEEEVDKNKKGEKQSSSKYDITTLISKIKGGKEGNKNNSVRVAFDKDKNIDVDKKDAASKLCWIVLYNNKKYTTSIFSPLKLYYSITKMNKLILTNLSVLTDKEKKKIIEICCNLIFYIGNISDLFYCTKTQKDNEVSDDQSNTDKNSKYNNNSKEYVELIYSVLDILQKHPEDNKQTINK